MEDDHKRMRISTPAHKNDVSDTPEEVPQSDYSKLYKNTSKTAESVMQQKREAFLNEHKEKHYAVFDENRSLSELFEESVGPVVSSETDTDGEPMEVQNLMEAEKESAPRVLVIKFKMTTSKWFTNIPEDLAEKWLVKLCPEGRRRLVVANKGSTKCFNRRGVLTDKFVSNLPGGGRTEEYKSEKSGMTVLHTVFHEESRTYFILDMLVWNGVSFLNCEAELRHFWIRAKFMELPEYFEPYGIDSYTFKVVFHHTADKDIIKSELFQYKSKCDVPSEGLVFYHRESPYRRKHPGMVTWLKTYMVPEKLQIDIPPEYEAKKPEDYVDLKTFLARQKVMRREWRKVRKTARAEKTAAKSKDMETEPIET